MISNGLTWSISKRLLFSAQPLVVSVLLLSGGSGLVIEAGAAGSKNDLLLKPGSHQ